MRKFGQSKQAQVQALAYSDDEDDQSDLAEDKELDIVATDIFFRNLESKKRIIVNRGGAGSSKSFSLCQLILYWLINFDHLKIFVCRKSQPAVRQSCYSVLSQLASDYGIRESIIEEKVHMNWYFGMNLLHFGGLDDPEKVKSVEYNVIWMEEATEFTFADFKQLLLRLRAPQRGGFQNRLIMSFNPVDEFHWIKKDIIDSKNYDVEEIHSTYLDNPFLDTDARQDLKNLEMQDPTFYNIYTLGEWGRLENLIYKNWDIVDWMPDVTSCDRVGYGMDFGYNDPTVLLNLRVKKKDVWIEELIYHTKLTTSMVIPIMQEKIPELWRNKYSIFADPSRPEEIQEIKLAGFKVKEAVRSIVPGIDSVKKYNLHVMSNSLNVIRELRAYSWKKDRNGNVIDEPVGKFDHAPDSLRYYLHTISRVQGGLKMRWL